MTRTALRLALVASLLVTLVAAPGAVAAADPTTAAPRSVRFEAGTHTGYRFDGVGSIIGTKTATLPKPSGASTTRRAYISGRGTYLLIKNGIWAGYYVKESLVAHVGGAVAERTFSPTLHVPFPAGTIVGYRFDGNWQVTSARIGTLGAASGAKADRFAVINGVSYYSIANGGWAGTWVPLRGGALRTLDCRTGARAGGGEQLFAGAIPNAGAEVALTFDMGGRVDPAMRIMRTLLLHGVCTTLFPTGAMGQTAIGQQVLGMVKTYPQLFEVGNHTWHHCDLRYGGGGSPSSAPCPSSPPSRSFVHAELVEANNIIRQYSGQNTVPYWRPPYGSQTATLRTWAAEVGYTKTFMWDIDTIDWKEVVHGGPTASQIASKVVTNAVNGSDVLMHLGGWNTADALPSMIYGLRNRGFALSSLSDLLDGS